MRTRALILGFFGLATFAVGVVLSPAQAYFSYLAAYVCVIGVVLGALVLLMIELLIAASWFVVMRRFVESIAAGIPLLALLFLPVVAGVRWLYPWIDLTTLDVHARTLVQQKAAYLNLPFFFIRAAIYFVSWIGLVELMRRWSIRQDHEPGEQWTLRLRALSAPGLIVLSFTLTFAAFDWVMSLAPTWFSTIFGLQIFAGGMVGALALLAVLAADGERQASLAGAITPEHLSAIGKMLFTFVIFWAYATFSQLLIIWIANIPVEVTWYVPRLTGSWLWLGLGIGVGHFVVPFSLLLSYELKRQRRILLRLGVWMLTMHYLELYWIVMPQLDPAGVRPHWLDASALAMVGGLTMAWVSWRAEGHAPIAIGDPELLSSLRYSES